MAKNCKLSISKIKVLDGFITDGFPKLKVHYLLAINNRVIKCSQIIDDKDIAFRNWDCIEKFLLKQYV